MKRFIAISGSHLAGINISQLSSPIINIKKKLPASLIFIIASASDE
jgi:hypothetical protein